MSYHYPIDETWTKEEVIQVVQFFSLVEQAYEKNVDRTVLLTVYNDFKKVVPSKSEEKKLFREFEQGSGYACFPVIRYARDSDQHKISMK
ncbi:UPF0223 family protein [Virgibacillus salarius]|uniref:UPF0223 family protein n=1 Tax=Virgibacillus salarius TaxID=447199 RepID=UPI0024904347|nr:UPF0223 family protein [Virgibacillus salarius]WBX79692.1 UPF0223 family protein [Virgibacillus salarius]